MRFLLAVLLWFVAGAATAQSIVTVDQGKVQGAGADGIDRFLGLPYAAPPVGDGRWAPPGPAPAWDGVRDGAKAPPKCPQSPDGLAKGVEAEDCLYLNIYRPSQPGTYPVYVYVHGGSAVAGSANDLDGSALARQGILVVTINYRLGALGFMDSPLVSPGGGGGNYALLDVIAALKWVRHNVSHFGGDPDQVTIGGESAGGTIVCPVMMARPAQGLYRAAIISSDDCLHDVDTEKAAWRRAVALAKKLGCTDAACLRQKTPQALVAAGGEANPMVSPSGLVPDFGYNLIASGDWPAVPMLIGSNHDEGRAGGKSYLGYDAAHYTDWLHRLMPPDQADKVAAAYADEHAGDPHEIAYKISAILTDSGMRGYGGCSNLQLARNAARAAPVWYYQFEDPSPPYGDGKLDFQFGAAHGSDLPFLWPGARYARDAARFTPQEHQLSEDMLEAWAEFIKTGRAGWPSLTPDGGEYMAFRTDGSRVAPLEAVADLHKCALWDAYPWVLDRG
ncbi:carboxylesterase/lipase family protein [Asticcacaulis solisilvae]|uniref:carboxylesterase/lipase family protein n=1 Tax=Asticcacaulis solisilvae TaxID=1217274 RepID=UPI003FD6E6A2